MKNSIPVKSPCSPFRCLAFITFIALLVLTVGARADDKPKSVKADEASKAEPSFDLEFDNLPLSEVVRALRNKNPGANFVVTPEISDALVPALKLHDVNVEEALTAVCLAIGGQVGWQNANAMAPMVPGAFGNPAGMPGGPAIDPATGLPIQAEARKGSKPMYYLFPLPGVPKPPKQNYAFELNIHNEDLIKPASGGKKETVPANLDNVVEFLRGQNREVTFVLGPGAGNVRLGELRLEGVGVEQLLEAIQVAGNGAVQSRHSTDSAGRLMVSFQSTRRAQEPLENLQVEAFNLEAYLYLHVDEWMKEKNPDAKNLKPEDLEKAKKGMVDEIEKMVEATREQMLELQDEAAQRHGGERIRKTGCRLAFHPETKLLVAAGDAESVAAASKVITALTGVKPSGSAELPQNPSATPPKR